MRRALLALAGAGAWFGLSVTSAAAGAPAPQPPGFCPAHDADGVTVVVDLGGRIQAGCVEDPGDMSGIQALEEAGFDVRTPRDFRGMVVCRIEGTPADEACVRMPDADHYWGYWQARNGGAWRYSTVGVASSTVIHGGFEGYAFVDGRRPAPPGIRPERSVDGSARPPTHVTAADDDASGEPGNGSLVATLGGIGVVGVLAVGAGVTARRRKRDGEGTT